MNEAEKAIARLERCVEFVLGSEGGYVNDKYDSGGETKYGISKASYPDLNIKDLTYEEAKEIYRRDYWDKCECSSLPEGLDIAVFDTAVNMGVGRAKEFLEKTQDIDRYIELRTNKYYSIVENKPAQKRFLNGWLNRIERLNKFIKENK